MCPLSLGKPLRLNLQLCTRLQLTCSGAALGLRMLRAWSYTQPAICLSTATIAANSSFVVKAKRTPAAINTPRAHVLHNQMHQKNETARQGIPPSLLPPPSRTLSATNSQTAHMKSAGPLHAKQAPTSALGARRRRRGSPHHGGRRLPRLTWRGAHRHRRRRPSRPRRTHRHLPWRRRPYPTWRWAVLPHTLGRAVGACARGRSAVPRPGRGWRATRGHSGRRGPLGRGRSLPWRPLGISPLWLLARDTPIRLLPLSGGATRSRRWGSPAVCRPGSRARGWRRRQRPRACGRVLPEAQRLGRKLVREQLVKVGPLLRAQHVGHAGVGKGVYVDEHRFGAVGLCRHVVAFQLLVHLGSR